MLRILTVLCLAGVCWAQIPGIGWCPDKRAMPGFDIDRYLGTWYEAERYFTVLEAGSRCARTNYTKAVDGRILVSNEITNRVTGVKRVLDGEIRNIPKGGIDSKVSVKYSTLPFPMETEYIILDTDYDAYSVVWSCSGLGPIVNTQSAWVMTRERLPPGTVLQKAYAVLDKHKISRTFFVRAEQEECALGEAAPPEGETSRSADSPVIQEQPAAEGLQKPEAVGVELPKEPLQPLEAEQNKESVSSPVAPLPGPLAPVNSVSSSSEPRPVAPAISAPLPVPSNPL